MAARVRSCLSSIGNGAICNRTLTAAPKSKRAAALVAVAVADVERLPFRVFKSYDEAIQWLHQDEQAGE